MECFTGKVESFRNINSQEGIYLSFRYRDIEDERDICVYMIERVDLEVVSQLRLMTQNSIKEKGSLGHGVYSSDSDLNRQEGPLRYCLDSDNYIRPDRLDESSDL